MRGAVGIPALKKDFHVDPIQLLEAKALGASAALLIARALSPDASAHRWSTARASWGSRCWSRSATKMSSSVRSTSARTIIGINNRNLETLVIDPETAERLLALIPRIGHRQWRRAVCESRRDVERVAAAGADAVLVGSVISARRGSDGGGARPDERSRAQRTASRAR